MHKVRFATFDYYLDESDPDVMVLLWYTKSLLWFSLVSRVLWLAAGHLPILLAARFLSNGHPPRLLSSWVSRRGML